MYTSSMNIALNERIPAIQKVNLNWKNHGLGGIVVGSTFILHGISIGLDLIPKNAPIITKGEEQHIHNTNKLKYSLKLTAAEDPSTANKKLIIEYNKNVIPGKNTAVSKAVFNQ